VTDGTPAGAVRLRQCSLSNGAIMRYLFIASLIAAMFALVACVPEREDVPTLIKHLSQEFSDASANGDARMLAKLLHERVLFMSEGGDMPTRKEIVDSAQPPAGGTSNTLMQENFKIEVHGNVAVTAFTDVSTVHFHGQTLHAKYLSTEVWLRGPLGWKMISSQTMAAQDDPPAVSLPREMLDDYVGTYQAGADFTYRIERNGDELTGIAQGGTPVALKAELRDVLFTPGQPRTRRIFQRDESGKVIGFVSRREGHDVVLKRVGTS
jgi:ketosteroid isomerase-like protein